MKPFNALVAGTIAGIAGTTFLFTSTDLKPVGDPVPVGLWTCPDSYTVVIPPDMPIPQYVQGRQHCIDPTVVIGWLD